MVPFVPSATDLKPFGVHLAPSPTGNTISYFVTSGALSDFTTVVVPGVRRLTPAKFCHPQEDAILIVLDPCLNVSAPASFRSACFHVTQVQALIGMPEVMPEALS